MGGVILGRNHDPRSPLVQAVDDAGPRNSAYSGQVLTVVEKSVDEGASSVPMGRMNDHVRSLVDDYEITVLVKNGQGDRFWRDL